MRGRWRYLLFDTSSMLRESFLHSQSGKNSEVPSSNGNAHRAKLSPPRSLSSKPIGRLKEYRVKRLMPSVFGPVPITIIKYLGLDALQTKRVYLAHSFETFWCMVLYHAWLW